MRTFWLPVMGVAATVLMLEPRPALAASYEGPGPLKTTTVPVAPVNGQMAYPEGPGPFPVLVLGHGFSATPDNQIGWGVHFASYGFVAIAPSLCTGGFCAPDLNALPTTIMNTLAYLDSPASPVKGKVDLSRLGLEGHSAGGQAMTVMAAKLKPTAVVLFDPVPGMGMGGGDEPGKTALSQVCSPVLSIFAENSSCNSTGAWKPFAFGSTGPRLGAIVKGSTHCDGENNARALCGLTCGGAADPKRQGRYGHYATAWFLGYLKGDAAAAGEVTLAKMQADSMLHDSAAADGPDCGSGGAAGAGGASAGAGGGSGAGAAGSSGGPSAGGSAGAGAGGSPGAGAGGAAAAGGTSAGSAGVSAGGGTAAGGGGAAGAGASGSATGGAGGSSSGGAGGTPASGGAGSSAGAGSGDAATPAGDSGGCGCRTSAVGSPHGMLLALTAWLAARARRRR